MKRLSLVLAALGVATACELENPCDRLADYVCDCHEDQEACQAYLNLADDPGAAVQDECIVTLDELRAEDEEAGLDCAV